jgi:hypothetical protein
LGYLEGEGWNLNWITDVWVRCVLGEGLNLNCGTYIRVGCVEGEGRNVNYLQLKEWDV